MRIGNALVRSGLITESDLQTALTEQQKTNDRLGKIVIQLGFVTAENITPVLADHFQMPYVDLKRTYKDIKPEVIDMLPLDLASRFHVIPIEIENEKLSVAITDPLNLDAIDTIRRKTNYKIQCVLAAEADIGEAIEYCYHNLHRASDCIDNFISFQDVAPAGEESGEELYDAGDQPVVQYVKSLIIHAVNSHASDVILQPKQGDIDLRFRIDGMLYTFKAPPKVMMSAIATRIKIISGLDIAERRLPQDGRFKVEVGAKTVDIRTSTFPTIYGESVVLRILDTSQPLLGIAKLGIDPREAAVLKELVHYSYGLILVTGPTGSGKTTTLYSALNEIKSEKKNIITLEDPVEYRLPFIQQSQVNPKIDFTFAKGLRSILRQDPDVIMVGEIRDKETAEIAVHAALTGHLVFSTLHTNDAIGAVVRLVNMGIEPFLIASSLLGVVAQRLIREICPECRQPYAVDKALLRKLGIDQQVTKFYKGAGCPACMSSGYKGRQGIYELFVPNSQIRRYILEKRSSEDIQQEAQKQGMRPLREACIEKLKSGITTPEEVLRVTQETEG